MWNYFCSMFTDIGTTTDMADMTMTVINPATGLPMLGDSIGGVDAGGSPFGMDIHAAPPDFGSGIGSTPWD